MIARIVNVFTKGFSPPQRKMAEARQSGRTLNPCRPEVKAWLKEEWDRTDIDEQVRCEEMSELTEVIAKRRRALRFEAPAPLPLPGPPTASTDVVPLEDTTEIPAKIAVHSAVSDPGALAALGCESLAIDAQIPEASQQKNVQFDVALYEAFRKGTG